MSGKFRAERLESLMQSELGKLIIREVDIPPGVLVNISNVDITSDNRSSKIGVNIYPEDRADEIIKLLNKSSGRLHYKLIRVLNIRTVPTLEFNYDTGSENAAKVEKILKEL